MDNSTRYGLVAASIPVRNAKPILCSSNQPICDKRPQKQIPQKIFNAVPIVRQYSGLGAKNFINPKSNGG